MTILDKLIISFLSTRIQQYSVRQLSYLVFVLFWFDLITALLGLFLFILNLMFTLHVMFYILDSEDIIKTLKLRHNRVKSLQIYLIEKWYEHIMATLKGTQWILPCAVCFAVTDGDIVLRLTNSNFNKRGPCTPILSFFQLHLLMKPKSKQNKSKQKLFRRLNLFGRQDATHKLSK